MSVTRYKRSRHFAVHDEEGHLICLTVYKKGGLEVERRLKEKNMENEPHPICIGYATLEAWLESIDVTQPVLAMPLLETGTEECGMRTDRLLVVAEQIDTSGHVHYVRLFVASLTRCYGEPFSSDWQEREAAWHSLWDVIEAELRERKLTIRRACVAFPTRYRLLEGRADCVVFDRGTQRFQRRKALEGGGLADAATALS